MKQSGIGANAHVCIQAWAIFVYDCAVFGDTFECVYEVLVHAFFIVYFTPWTIQYFLRTN